MNTLDKAFTTTVSKTTAENFSKSHLSKRNTVLLFLLLFLSPPFFLSAHPPKSNSYRNDNSAPSGWVFNVYSIFSYYRYAPQPGEFSISFPYVLNTRNSPSVATTKIFRSQTADLIGNGKWVYPSIGIEAGKENFTVEAQLGMYLHYWSDNLYGGINYRFILKRFHRNPDMLTLASTTLPGKNRMRRAASFPVKISAGIFYYQPIWKLGNIDIGDNQIKTLGETMQPLDSTNVGGSGNVTVFFHQNILAFKPSFSIGFSPPNNRLDICLSVSPIINLSETGGLRFYLNNSGNVDWVPRNGIDPEAVIPLDTFGLNATFKGEKQGQSPFRLKGTIFTLKVGIRIVK
jgi:hypothetical protein